MKKILVILITPIILLFCSACSSSERKLPYGWCMSEIKHHEKYDEVEILGWGMQEVILSDSKDKAESYIITVMTDSPNGDGVTFDYWFCFIEYKFSLFWEGITREQIIYLDCDWLKTEIIGNIFENAELLK